MKDLIETLEFAGKRMGRLVEKPADPTGQVLVSHAELLALYDIFHRVQQSLSVREFCKATIEAINQRDLEASGLKNVDLEKVVATIGRPKPYRVREIETVINAMQPSEGFARLKIESELEATKWLNVSREDLLTITKLLEVRGVQ